MLVHKRALAWSQEGRQSKPIFRSFRFACFLKPPNHPSSHQSRISLSLSLSIFSQHTIYSPHVALITGPTTGNEFPFNLRYLLLPTRVALTYFPKRPNPSPCVFARIDRPDSLPYPPLSRAPTLSGQNTRQSPSSSSPKYQS
jgi:hypothetical protein